MKEYSTPTVEVLLIENKDVITASLGTETSIIDEFDGAWDFTQKP